MKYFLILILILCATAHAQVLQPPSLNPGDEYRLAFVTSTVRNATSTDIEDYNRFVQQTADAAPIVGPWGLEWKVVGSTATVDARDNTGTNPETDGPGVPIWLIDGTTLLAPSNLEMWSADFQNSSPFNFTETGTRILRDESSITTDVFTGTTAQGVAVSGAAEGRTLGGLQQVRGGDSWSVYPEWIFSESFLGPLATSERHLYAFSESLVAVPEPSSWTLVACGCMALLLRRKRGR